MSEAAVAHAGTETAVLKGIAIKMFANSFADVPVDEANDNAIPTSAFLDAATGLTSVFEILGATFTLVKNDIVGNIKLTAPLESETIQDLCRNEKKAKLNEANDALLWLVRGLAFTCEALQSNLANPDEELATSFRKAYTHTLKPHHSFVVKPVFSAAMSACPYRADFWVQLTDDMDAYKELKKTYLQGLARIVGILQVFLGEK